jgi:putative ABC transport system permease protein
VQGFLQDLRFALRGLLRRPGFALVVVLTLALGIGANTAIFGIVYGVLLRPLTYAQADQLVRLWRHMPEQGVDRGPVSPQDFLAWREQSRVLASLAAFAPSFATLTGGDEPRELRDVRVSADLFRLLGVRPASGRGFLPGEDRPGAAPVAVVSDGLWHRVFHARRDLLGASILLDGVSYRVVGIMPADFEFESGELWTPLVFKPADLLVRGRSYLGVIGRLAPGVTLERARADMDTVARRLALEHPESNQGVGAAVVPLYEQIVGDIRPTLLMLMAAVGFVLLIACANVGNLLLARTTERQGEMGMRVALGASRGRLVRQTVTETLLLALLSGLSSLLLAKWLLAWLVHLNPPHVPRLGDVRLDLPVLAFTFLASLAAGALFGWGPALQTARFEIHEILKEGSGRGGAAGGRLWLRDALAVVQVALALVLLIGAGLLVRSFQRLLAVDPGFRPQNVLTAFLALPQAEYAEPGRQLGFREQLLQQVRALPGVRSAALATTLPLGAVASRQTFLVDGQDAPPERAPMAVVDAVSPGFFRAMGIELRRGRTIEESDRRPAPPVVVVDESLAKLWFPKGDAVGRRLILPGLSPQSRQIVGVVGAVKRTGLDADSMPQVYLPLDENPSRFLSVVLRADGDPTILAPAVRRAVWSVDRNLPVEIDTLQGALDESLAQTRFNTRLISVLGVLALALAVVGIYAVMAYSVARRRHEIGVRLAMGGQKGQIVELVMRHALALTAIGLAIGLLGALVVTRLVAGLLFGVTSTDPATFIALPLLLGVVALAASYLPARRATRIDPAIALRTE